MAVEPGLASQVEELFAALGPIRTKRMFGGLGVYCGDLFFALADDGMIYLKGDDANEDAFREAGSALFSYPGRDGEAMTMRYWRLPEAAFDDPDEAVRWGRLGVEAAIRAKSKPSKRKAKAP